MTSYAQPPRPERSASEWRILEAAEEAFLGVPRDAVKISDIAQAAEVSVGLIYLQFGSKFGLYGAVREQIHVEFIEFTLGSGAADDDLTFDHLLDYYRRWELALLHDFDRTKLLGSVDLALPDEHMASVNDRSRTRVTLAVAELGRRVSVLTERGLVRPCSPYETAGWIYTGIWGASALLLQAPAGSATPEVISQLFAFHRRMLAQALLPLPDFGPDGSVPARYLG